MLNKSNEIECNEVNNLNIKLDSEYLNKDSLYKLAQHTEKMDTSIESLGSNRKIILINLCTRQISQNPYPIRVLPS